MLDEEIRQIYQKVRTAEHRDSLEFDLRWAARTDDLLQALNETSPQVVHFSGHGGREGLSLVTADGHSPHSVAPAALEQLFRIFSGELRLVVLSACFSRPQAEAIADQVGVVVGTPGGISDRAAVTFNGAFYRALAFGRSVGRAFEQANAALALDHPEEQERGELVVGVGVDSSRIVLIAPEGEDERGSNSAQASASVEPRVPSAEEPPLLTPMYSLIVSGNENAWEGRRYGISIDRFLEHTTEGVRARFISLDGDAIRALLSIPALLAYEQGLDRPARVARVTRVVLGSRDEIRLDFEAMPGIPPIPPRELTRLRWELDITDREMHRTHWAIKQIDLLEVLREAGLVQGAAPEPRAEAHAPAPPRQPVDIFPTVFAIPTTPRDPRSVAVMMPFARDFDETYEEIRKACEVVGLRGERADTIWEESTIIQDVFNLIYRSAVVIVDLSGRNPNVMYECGIAHTLGRPVLPIARGVDALPFDLLHHRVLTYLPNTEGHARLREKLESRLRSLVGSLT